VHSLPVRNYFFPALLIVVGAALLLQRFHLAAFGWSAVAFAVIALAGGLKLYGGFATKSRGRVFWGLFWFVLGSACLLRTWGYVPLEPGIVVSGLLLVFGAGMILMFLVSRGDWYLLVPAACLLVVGGAILATELGYFAAWDVPSVVNRWWPAGLVLSGLALILNALPASSSRSRHPL
jgi:hypothetical protein